MVTEIHVQASRGKLQVSPELREPRDAMGTLQGGELVEPTLPRKAASEITGARTANRHR